MTPLVLKLVAGFALTGAVNTIKSSSKNPNSLALLLVLAAASGVASVFVERGIDAYFVKPVPLTAN